MDFPIFQADLENLFGEPNEGQFAQDYLRTIDLPEFVDALAHVVDYEGNPWSHKIYGNYVMADPLRAAFGLIVSRGLAGELRTYDGCFNIRRKKGGSGYSVHSWGLAVDFNAATNPFGQVGDMSPDLIKCFAECGFESGSLWTPPTQDFMHFQLAWIRVRTDGNPLNPIAWGS